MCVYSLLSLLLCRLRLTHCPTCILFISFPLSLFLNSPLCVIWECNQNVAMPELFWTICYCPAAVISISIQGDPVSHFLNCGVWSNYRQLSVGPINARCSTHAEPTSGSRIEAHNRACNSVFMYTSTLSAVDSQCFTHVRMYGDVREGNMAVLWNGVVCSRYISPSPMLVSLSSAMGFWLC